MCPLPRLPKKNFISIAGTIMLTIVIGIQFIRPELRSAPVTGDVTVPGEIKSIFIRACYDCHSNTTQLSWFDKISPVIWRVSRHIRDGRAGLNFSEWDHLTPVEQKGKLWEAYNQMALGAMPLQDYEFVHPASRISFADLAVIKKYLNTTIYLKANDTSKIHAADIQYDSWQHTDTKLNNLPVAVNGISYMPAYKNWQPLSASDRFDNGTMRIIYGNAVAVKAANENKMHPWPKGSTFAKVLWTQLADNNGNVRTGSFIQVDYMVKDDNKYASTGGWGYARFKTPKLIPYGKTVLFATECVNCHSAVENKDYIFTFPIK